MIAIVIKVLENDISLGKSFNFTAQARTFFYEHIVR